MSRNFLIRLQSVYHTLKSAEKKAADYMFAKPHRVAEDSVGVTASLAGCSEATLTRIARKLGYTGYSELRAAITAADDASDAYGDISETDDEMETARKVFRTSIQALSDTLDLIDPAAYKKALQLLRDAGRFLFLGVGDAYTAVYSAYLKFLRIGKDVRCPQDFDLQLIEASQLKENDVVFIVSHSGRTHTLNEVVKCARSQGAKVITVTDHPISPISKQSDVVLQAAAFMPDTVGEVVAKRIPALCLAESLYINLINRMDKGYLKVLENSNEALKTNKL